MSHFRDITTCDDVGAEMDSLTEKLESFEYVRFSFMTYINGENPLHGRYVALSIMNFLK